MSPSDHRVLITYEALGLRRNYGPHTLDLLRTHALPRLGLSAQTSGKAQHEEPCRAPGYRGQHIPNDGTRAPRYPRRPP